jgi:Flp pilus assembly protein TadD
LANQSGHSSMTDLIKSLKRDIWLRDRSGLMLILLECVQAKWEPVRRPDTRKNKELELDGHSKKSHPALEARAMRGAYLAALLCLGGCQSSSLQDITGSIDGAADHTAAAQPDERRSTEELGRQYDRNPEDKSTALSYAKALRSHTEYAQAAAILQRLAAKYPEDPQVLSAYGKALADTGRLHEAAEVLAHAHTPERPDWSVLSAQGSVADQLGEHEQAQAYYAAALKIVPAEPHVLSNLGLSYALSKKLPQAEKALQEAAAQPDADKRVRQNLALVLALEGKFTASEEMSRRDLEIKEATANIAAIRRMIAQSNTWKQIQALDSKSHSNADTRVGSNLD